LKQITAVVDEVSVDGSDEFDPESAEYR
jgi:hypothetical protein